MEETRRVTDRLQRMNSEMSPVPLWLHGFIKDRPWALPRDGVVAASHSPGEAEEAFFNAGLRWREMGLHTYPSPTVNVPLFDTCIMRDWAISSDPEITVRYARAITRGLIRARCGTMAQHFPAHGATALDSHKTVPVIDLDLDTLMRDHIPPYIASFEEGCTTICTAHLKCPALDPDENNIATTSRAILTDFLRGRLGFQGVTIADAIGMTGFRLQGDAGETTIRAVMAGCDSICILADDLAKYVYKALLAAARDGRLTAERLDEAVMRNLAFKRWLGIL
jgi:beta-N-acetylhexosaminidase